MNWKGSFVTFTLFSFAFNYGSTDFVPLVYGDEWRPLYRGARAQAMGNAFVAVADDEQALFYNPAGLAGIKRFSFTVASANLDVSNDLINNYPTITNVLSSPSLTSLNTFLGKNLYARAEGMVAFTLPGFEIAGIYDQQVAIRLKNLAFPQGVLGSQTTDGVQAGFGFRVLKLKRKKGEWRVGLSAKVLWRAGGFQTPSLTQLLTLNSQSITSNISSIGIGYGMDLGSQFIYNFRKNIVFMSGLAFTDIGTTSFASAASPQLSNLTAGLAAKYTASDMILTFAYDYAHLLDSTMDWTRKLHMGLELKFPVVSLSIGMSALSLTYGVSLDFWLLRASYVVYSEDQATVSNVDSEARTMASVMMKFDF